MITVLAAKLWHGQKCLLGGLRAKMVLRYPNGMVRLVLLEDGPAVWWDELPLCEPLLAGDEVILAAGRHVQVEPVAPPASTSPTTWVPKDGETLT